MFPYWTVPGIQLGPVGLRAPLLLAGAGILIVHFSLLRRAKSKGLSQETAGMMSLAMVAVGLLAAYWFRGVYLAQEVQRDWTFLLQLQTGAASFGGIGGGLLAGWAYLTARRLPTVERLRYLDALAAVFPSGWIVGRMGCALAHDHPGLRTTSWLGVHYPDGVRFDLGLLEVFFLGLAVIPIFAALDRKPRTPGFWLGLFLTIYGVFRLFLDQLHVDPPRYGLFTVDQWAYGAAAILGAVILLTIRRRPNRV